MDAFCTVYKKEILILTWNGNIYISKEGVVKILLHVLRRTYENHGEPISVVTRSLIVFIIVLSLLNLIIDIFYSVYMS